MKPIGQTLRKILYALTFFVLISCKKDSEIKKLNGELIGAWELSSSSGFDEGTQDYADGNGNKLIFTKSTLTVYENNSLKGTTNYSIVRKDDCENAKKYLYLGTSDNSVYYTDDIISVSGDELRLSSVPPCGADGGVSIYKRVD
ncbi:MAG: hypothetical protein QM640_04975 [Niabella sp.]